MTANQGVGQGTGLDTQPLSRVLWIGGATDAGKSTTARILAQRHGLIPYHYDQRDLAHHEALARSHPAYAAFMAQTLDERWIEPDAGALFRRMTQTARDRFPLVLADLLDLLARPGGAGVVAEGFGLLPDLLAGRGISPGQAVFLLPTTAFKRELFARRGKPSFAAQTRDPDRARSNLLERDLRFTRYLEEEAGRFGYACCRVDGSRGVEATADLLERRFAGWFSEARGS